MLFDKVRNFVAHARAFATAGVGIVSSSALDVVVFVAKIATGVVDLAERVCKAVASVITNETPAP